MSLRTIVWIDTIKELYNAIVQPNFDYVYVIYDSAMETGKTRLQRLQTGTA